jgi:hypothetical protein
MSIPAEFQEREYESLFIQELSKMGSATWSPGQTDEFLLGFDGAAWIKPWSLLRFGFPAGAPRPPFWPIFRFNLWQGRELGRELFREWEDFAEDFFPARSFNFFVQHKRPHQSTAQGASGDYWKQAYFEFKIDKQQQMRLEKLEHALGAGAVVTYSCPAFMLKRELWAYEKNAKLIANTNFVSPSLLKGHSRYTFLKPGHSGFANEDPEIINGEPLRVRFVAADERSEGGLSSQILNAGNAIHDLMSEEPEESAALYRLILERLSEVSGRISGGLLFQAIKRIVAFNGANGTSWVVLTRPQIME